MTVLYVIDTLVTGGAEKSLLEICSRLGSVKPVVCVVLSRNPDLENEFRSKGIELIHLGVKSRWWWIEGVLKFRRIVRNIKPDLVHSTLFKADIISRIGLLGSRIPCIGSFVSDSYGKARLQSFSFSMRCKIHMIKLIDALTAQRVDHFVSITEAIVRNNCRALGVSASKVSVIYRGRNIDLLLNAVSREGTEHLRSRFKNNVVFLSVARLIKMKGYRESIRAFAKVRQEIPSAIYLIAGEGNDRPCLERLITDLRLEQSVFLLGTRNDVPTLLSFADFFVFPSHFEGQGGALVEAMLFGKPIIATKIPVIEESVKHDYSARLFAYRDTEDLFRQMLWMAQHPREAGFLGLNARKEAIEKFNMDRIVSQHEMLYSSLLQRSK